LISRWADRRNIAAAKPLERKPCPGYDAHEDRDPSIRDTDCLDLEEMMSSLPVLIYIFAPAFSLGEEAKLPKINEGNRVDLLSLVNPTKHVVSGKWSKVRGELASIEGKSRADRANSR
jgi:hypothetical protein